MINQLSPNTIKLNNSIRTAIFHSVIKNVEGDTINLIYFSINDQVRACIFINIRQQIELKIALET